MSEECPIPEHTALLGIMDSKVSALEVKDTEHKEFHNRISTVERQMDVLKERISRYDTEFTLINNNFKLLDAKQDSLRDRMPSRDEWDSMKKAIQEVTTSGSRKWEGAKTVALTATITGAIAYILTKIFV